MRQAAGPRRDEVARRLKLRDLRYLLAIADHGSMARAAAHMRVSQPAISKAMNELENTIGVRLLERGPRGVEPTAYGHALIKRGQAIVDELEQGVGEIDNLADPSAGQVRIGCPEAVAAGLLAPIIGAFIREYPRAELMVDQTSNAALDFRELRERKLDLMIGRIARPFSEHALQAEILFQEQIFVVVGVRNPFARRRNIGLADLVDARWVRAPSHSQVGALHSEAFAARGLAIPPPAVATFSMHLALHLVENDGFVATLPSVMLHLCKSRAIKVLSLSLPIERRPIAIVKLKDRTLGPLALRFIDCVRAATKSIDVWPEPPTRARLGGAQNLLK